MQHLTSRFNRTVHNSINKGEKKSRAHLPSLTLPGHHSDEENQTIQKRPSQVTKVAVISPKKIKVIDSFTYKNHNSSTVLPEKRIKFGKKSKILSKIKQFH